MTADSEPPQASEEYCAFRLGYARFTVRAWQELEWTWLIQSPELQHEDASGCVSQSLDDLSDWRWGLLHRIRDELSGQIKQWIDGFRQRWEEYYGSEEHVAAVAGLDAAAIPDLRQRNPFDDDFQELIRLTSHPGLFADKYTELWRWFRIGSTVGRCEYVAGTFTPESPEFAEALRALAQTPGLPDCLRTIVDDIRHAGDSSARADLVRQLVRDAEAILGDSRHPLERQLVVVKEPQEVYSQGIQVRRLNPVEWRMVKAFADRPGKLISKTGLAGLIGSDTDAENISNYLSRLLQKIATSCTTADNYGTFRRLLKADVFATDRNTHKYYLKLPAD